MSIDLSGDVRGISVQQPWSSAIVFGQKRTENRPRMWAPGTYLIHASKTWDRFGGQSSAVREWFAPHMTEAERDRATIDRRQHPDAFLTGVVLGVGEVVECHYGHDCCKPWGWWGADIHHLVFGEVRPLPVPVVCKGSLGPWKPPADVLAAVRAQLAEVST